MKMFSFLVITLFCGAAMGDSFFPKDLTTVKWKHAVNSKAELEEALKSNVHMLEADVSVSTDNQPIMAHPPTMTSDLTLKEFLNTVQNITKKGIKLDFKSTQAFNLSVPLLEDFKTKSFPSPVWLNADILKGPGGAEEPQVDATTFLTQAKAKFGPWTLSVGWTTVWSDADQSAYTLDDVNKMNSTLTNNKIVPPQPVTFAVRAAIVAKSETPMKTLVGMLPGTTLTVWSNENDKNISFSSLRKIIDEIGRERVYVDMPEDQLKQLNSASQAVLSSACILIALGAFAAKLW